MPSSRVYTFKLAASSSNNIALAQTANVGALLTLNGAVATGNLDVPRRIAITTLGNESTNTFTITGFDYFGRVQTEVLPGSSASSSYTFRDFSSVSSISVASTTSSTITAGTNGVGSTVPWVVDQWVNPTNIGIGTITGTQAGNSGVSNIPVTYSIEASYDSFVDSGWDLTKTPPTYFPVENFNAVGNSAMGSINSPVSLIRTTILSGTGSVTTNLRQGYVGRS